MFLSLTLICVIVGVILGGVYAITKDPIAAAEQAKQDKALKAVSPEFDAISEVLNTTTPNGKEASVTPLLKDGKPVGYAVQVIDMGFGGEVKILFGFDNDLNITGYSVLSHQETPGLGSKMPEWFAEGGKGNVIGKNPANDNLTVSKDGGTIDAITAATISSRCFCRALNTAYALAATSNVAEQAETPEKEPEAPVSTEQ